MRRSRVLEAIGVLPISLIAAYAYGQSHDDSTLPDWHGVWQMTSNTVFDQATVEPPGSNANFPGTREFPPYNAEWEAKYEANLARKERGELPDPQSICGTPAGYPRLMNLPGLKEFVVTPRQVWLISEEGPNVLRIHTDGRAHPPPDELWPTFGGESVGHWEGDTLVFETISLKGEGATILDRTGLILSEQARIVTRMREVEPDLIEAHFAINDPEALTETWNVVKQYRREPTGTRMIDVACAENNRNPIDSQGRTLTLDREGNILDRLD